MRVLRAARLAAEDQLLLAAISNDLVGRLVVKLNMPLLKLDALEDKLCCCCSFGKLNLALQLFYVVVGPNYKSWKRLKRQCC